MIKSTRYKSSFAMILLSVITWGGAQAETAVDESYSIISDSDFQNVKRSIEVRLDEKVSEVELESIAKELKSNEQKNYERTFITYYLESMKVGSGAWATSHFAPQLEVKILGSTFEEGARLNLAEKSIPRDVVGVWLDERPYVGSIVTIYREGTNVRMETKFEDGSGFSKKMTETKYSNRTKLVEVGGNAHDEYFVLDNKGNLQAGGRNGIFLKYKNIK